MDKETFYQRCADIMGVNHEFAVISSRRTRWGPRTPGNGRFPGIGIIRWFSPTSQHVSLTDPIQYNGWFKAPEEVYTFLEEMMRKGVDFHNQDS